MVCCSSIRKLASFLLEVRQRGGSAMHVEKRRDPGVGEMTLFVVVALIAFPSLMIKAEKERMSPPIRVEREDRILLFFIIGTFLVFLAAFLSFFSSLGARAPTVVGEKDGYWGPVDASVDWCEPNYIEHPYIAEWWNTVSCLVTVACGLLSMWCTYHVGGELRYYFFSGFFPTVGLGSLAFHGTMRRLMQAADEIPMVWITFCGLYCYLEMEHVKRLRYPWLPFVIGLSVSAMSVLNIVYHGALAVAVFYGSFMPCQLAFLWKSAYTMLSTKDQATKSVYRWSFFFYIVAVLAWCADGVFCAIVQDLPMGFPNPQLHAWWHVFIGFAAYGLIIAPLRERMDRLGKGCEVRYFAGLVPYTSLVTTTTGTGSSHGGKKKD